MPGVNDPANFSLPQQVRSTLQTFCTVVQNSLSTVQHISLSLYCSRFLSHWTLLLTDILQFTVLIKHLPLLLCSSQTANLQLFQKCSALQKKLHSHSLSVLQPLHKCLFPGATMYNTFISATNPHQFELDGAVWVSTSVRILPILKTLPHWCFRTTCLRFFLVGSDPVTIYLLMS